MSRSAGLSLIPLDTTDDLHSENHTVKTSGDPPKGGFGLLREKYISLLDQKRRELVRVKIMSEQAGI